MNVPKYGGQKIETRAIAPIRANVNSPIEAFGGGGANPGEAIASAANSTAKIVQTQIDNANSLALKPLKNELDQFHINQFKRGENGEPLGVFTTNGKDAFTEAPNRLKEEFQKKRDELLAKASNDYQRASINEMAANTWEQLDKEMATHSNSQRNEYDKAQTAASLKLNKDLAVIKMNDPAAVRAAMVAQVQAISTYGHSQGHPAEQIESDINTALSDLNTDIVVRHVDQNNVETARAYYERNKGLFHGDDIMRVEKLLKEGGTKSAAIKASNEIVGQYNDTYAALKAAEEKIKDPEELELTQTMIKAKMKEKNDAPLRLYDNRLMQAVESIDKNGDVAPSISDGLLPDGKRAVQQYALYKRGLLKIDPTNSVYLDYSNKSMEEMSRVSQSDMLLKVKTSTTPEQFKSIYDRWQISRDGMNGDPGAKAKWNSTGEDHASMLVTLKDAGVISDGLSMGDVNKNSKSRKIFINTYNDVTAEIDKEMANRGGKPLADEERKAIMKSVVNRTVKTSGIIFGTNESRVVEVNADDESSIRKVYLDPTEKAQMIQAAKVNGLIPMNMNPVQAETMLGIGMRKAKLHALKNGAFNSDEKAKELMDILRANFKGK